MVASKFLASHQNLPLFERNNRKPEDFCVALLVGPTRDGGLASEISSTTPKKTGRFWCGGLDGGLASQNLPFHPSKQPKTGRFWCALFMDRP